MSQGQDQSPRLAILAATSGHSGVDRILTNLIEQWAAWGLEIDLLQIRRHGPRLAQVPAGVSCVDLKASHVNTALPALVRYLRRERPVAMLCDKDRVNRVAIVARRLAGSPTRLCVRLGTAVSVNLAERGRIERLTQRLSMRYLYPLADRVIVPAQGVKLDLLSFAGLADAQVNVIRSPILTPAFTSLAAHPVPHPWLEDGQPPVIMGIGELCYRKQFETLVQAFALVRRERPCRLMILGRGRRHETLLKLARELGVEQYLSLPGFQSNPYAWLSRARVFVLSSLWEGLPVALIEALGLEVPAVATDCPGGPAEVLTNSHCGTLVPIQDPPAMATAIRHWLDTHAPPEAFAAMVAPYRIEVSATAYLDTLGLAPSCRR
ncbi:glycosyltransferase [Thiorhodovibrio frisius]|uniref:Glycosyltransferase n=1 Tax=Thiorhodovibrio frisius TaxID=631362 RepID=H8Z4M6_9GAMM|nr:glycosyltransferase [Thiorhodovibrio frisius]EIC20283.1 glycosyltransferase [Thiorhodovibrio frisius]WPL21020.1 N-acetylgalactosamine-N,N'-diacetylbacillosaminyl-diphospho-undecaprenol 4-alpha-N-acetylgalactosaminyltransferase [Thiorhodovibrio frisius]